MKTQDDFAGMSLDPRLLKAVTDLGFTKPTPVQMTAIPAGLAGDDVLGCAATGSGKTAAFMLPILQRIIDMPRGATRALVLVPTRELAAQVEEHTRELAQHTKITTAAIYGGVAMGPQVNAFKRGVDILVATPGRLLDHFGRDHGGLESVEVLVLDEADRMLDMGFLPEIRKIIRHLPTRARQTFFFSATMPPAIVKLAGEMLKNPARIEVERKQAPAAGVLQAFYPVSQTAKVPLLVELLKRGEVGNAIVFTRTKHRANRVAQKLERSGVNVARIHGNRSQKQREEALSGFKAGRYQVLVATDILARGIDVEALEHVVNFDVPASPEDYIHRVGRTGRAELTGDAYTFVTPEDRALVQAIERKVGTTIERRKLADFDYSSSTAEPLEVPLEERLAKMRAERAEARRRSAEKAERRAQSGAPTGGGRGRGRGGPHGTGRARPGGAARGGPARSRGGSGPSGSSRSGGSGHGGGRAGGGGRSGSQGSGGSGSGRG
ncbi:MAG: DEAD/DEAH box helicase [Gemmatimonadetes bacterium]|nr:DEAD/DEAH box helicase [Gemmatimonadota bacterium]